MIENTVRIQTRDGRMLSYYAHPDEPGAYPAVIIYMDAPGTRQELRDIAKRVAANGYFCLLPDMYYRLGELRFRLSHRDDAMSAVIGKCRYSINNEMVMSARQRCYRGWMDIPGPARSGLAVSATA